MRILSSLTGLMLLLTLPASGRQTYLDRQHFSQIFDQPRNYRIFLPQDYETADRHYPVIYYFHGHSDRYTLEHYDGGTWTVPEIAGYAAGGEVIVVAVDGYVAPHYTGFYGGDPWDVREDGAIDFGACFLELQTHIDESYRTLRSRRYRATSGLSMGGFMSLYLSARFPDRIGSASSFNPGPEFHVGDPGRRVLWRPKDHVPSHRHSQVRLIRASGDYISQYHEETRLAYARDEQVRFEFRQDEYHKHAVTSIRETFDFHRRAFQDPKLDTLPVTWSYASPFRQFEVWGYSAQVSGEEPALVYLSGVRQGGLRVTTRRWAPDGPPSPSLRIRIRTAPVYQANTLYRLLDLDLQSGRLQRSELHSDAQGRIEFEVGGGGHQISFDGPGTGALPPLLLPAGRREGLYVRPGDDQPLRLQLYNPRGEAMDLVAVRLQSAYPTARIGQGECRLEEIQSGEVRDLSHCLRASFTSGAGYYAPARLNLQLTYDGWHQARESVDVAILPEVLPAPAEFRILDGRTETFSVFRQAGNQGGGGALERQVSEGRGNGNGRLEPGEEATVWIRIPQGLDPFDKGNWYRCKIRTDSPWIEEIADFQETKQREWTGARERTSLIRVSAQAPSGASLELILENETWSFHYTPDVRYGGEPLYQAFQQHDQRLHRLLVEIP